MTGDRRLVLSAEAQQRNLRSFAAGVVAAYPDRPDLGRLVQEIARQACRELDELVRGSNELGD